MNSQTLGSNLHPRRRVLLGTLLVSFAVACGGETAAPDPTSAGGAADPAGGGPAAPAGASAPASGMLCAGESHSCVLQPGGTVLCSGRNRDGQLGDGTAQDRLTFVPVVGLTNAVDIDCAYSHTCAARADGHVVCWGRSAEGQLGAPGPAFAPVEVPGITDAVEVSTGRGFSCARHAGGSVSCWGAGADGQLGNGASNDSTSPVDVAGLSDATEIDSGYSHTCVRRANGAVSCWGKNETGALGMASPTRSNTPVEVAGVAGATRVGAGGNHSCAASATGLWCWGGNDHAQTGNGNEEVRSVPAPVAVPGVTGVTALALGSQRTCIATAADVRCWGYNNFTAGLLGIENREARNIVVPTVVPGITDAAVLASGDDFSCAIRTGGALSCWGSASAGQTGENARTGHPARDVVPSILTLAPPASVRPTFETAAGAAIVVTPHIAIGGSHVCAVTADGHVACFGENGDGQLGSGSTLPASSSAPSVVAGIGDAVQVVADSGTTCTRRADGTVACWGAMSEHGTPGWPESSSLPVPLAGITDAVDIALGSVVLCAVRRDGTVQCIGEGGQGELGNGAREDSATPVAVVGLSDVAHIATVGNTFCAMRTAGTVACWGRDAAGECGNGAEPCGATPVEVSGVSHATALDGGGRNFCAVVGGRVSCWGANDHGQLGIGSASSTVRADAPGAVHGLTGTASIGVGSNVICATNADGEAYCWGANAFGTSGADDAGTEATEPMLVHRTADAAVGAFAPYATADCASNFCCGLHRDGHLSCWGSTPLGGSGGLLGIANVRSGHPVVAPGFTVAVTGAATP